MKLTFYNHYGVGDLFESREFVKDWMRLCGVTQAEYAHRRLPGFFYDLPQITSVDVRPEMDMRQAVTWLKNGTRVTRSSEADGADALWVNTWIGARNGSTMPPGDYVLWPGVGCTVEHLYRMHNDYLREAGLPPLPRSILEYLPTIDYTRVHLGQVQVFIDEMRFKQGKRLVLLCNGATGSGHAANFDFGDMLELLPKGPIYVFTNPCVRGLCSKDVYFTDALTGRDEDPGMFDGNAISYLSRFCDVIVGRCSGAQMPCQVLENWMDSTKTLVCLTHHRNGACFVLNPQALGLKMRVVWSPAAGAREAAAVLKEVLNHG